jgi:hypothetical protein
LLLKLARATNPHSLAATGLKLEQIADIRNSAHSNINRTKIQYKHGATITKHDPTAAKLIESICFSENT